MPNATPDNTSLRLLLPYLRRYRGGVAAALLAIACSSAAVLGLGIALRYLLDHGLLTRNHDLLNHAYFIMLGVIGLLAIATYARYSLVNWLSERMVADLRADAFDRLLKMDVAYFERQKAGDILSRLTADATLLQTLISSAVPVALRNTVLVAGGLTLLLITSTQLTLMVLLALPLVVAPILLLARRVRARARETQARLADMSAEAEEAIAAMRTVQAMTLEASTRAAFAGRLQAIKTTSLSRIRIRALLTALVISLVFGAVLTVLWIGGHEVMRGTLSGGELTAFVFYSVVVASAVGALAEVIADLQRAAGAGERLAAMLSMQPQIISGMARPAHTGTAPRVMFDNVSFRFPARPDHAALEQVSFVAEPGRIVALVGPSGAGKSTVFQLLLRFYDPASGSVMVDGQDIRTLDLTAWREQIGLVPQDPFIFSTDIAANIRCGKTEATDVEVRAAAKSANALEFIERLPQGFATPVGEKGVQLSGGQQQRIAIARALIRNPRLLLLDEATSALDAENERAVQEALKTLMQGRTTLVVAHRLSTVMHADQIILLNHGKIEATGTHTELMNANGLYARLAQLQLAA